MATPDQIREKIDSLIKEKGYSLNELSIRIGREQTYLYQYVNRKSPKRLPDENRKKLAKILNINEQELTDMDLNELGNGISAGKCDTVIPEIDVYGGCGLAAEAETVNTMDQHGNIIRVDNIIDNWCVPGSYLEHIRVNKDSVCIIEALGDSMQPTINSGDKVIIDTSTKGKRPSPDGVFALWDGMGIVLKRIEVVPNSDPVTLKIISDNLHHSQYERAIDECNIIGRAVGTVRRM